MKGKLTNQDESNSNGRECLHYTRMMWDLGTNAFNIWGGGKVLWNDWCWFERILKKRLKDNFDPTLSRPPTQ
jgi:hypothetical protein